MVILDLVGRLQTYTKRLEQPLGCTKQSRCPRRLPLCHRHCGQSRKTLGNTLLPPYFSVNPQALFEECLGSVSIALVQCHVSQVVEYCPAPTPAP